MSVLKKLYPDEYNDAVHFFGQGLYSPCNMFVMKREVLNELCMWMFPIIFKCEEYIGEKEDSYQNRYPGFMAERLMSFFFESRKDIYKMVFADKIFMN